MVGAGGNYVWVDPLQQTVVVVRWLEPASLRGSWNGSNRRLPVEKLVAKVTLVSVTRLLSRAADASDQPCAS